ncbi:hypothetical protein F4802DRAFT_491558 [Xylaria palmicola]|nr:hypothetical protein F4802DRAFT_491558 [Xylaria palmicola]
MATVTLLLVSASPPLILFRLSRTYLVTPYKPKQKSLPRAPRLLLGKQRGASPSRLCRAWATNPMHVVWLCRILLKRDLKDGVQPGRSVRG